MNITQLLSRLDEAGFNRSVEVLRPKFDELMPLLPKDIESERQEIDDEEDYGYVGDDEADSGDDHTPVAMTDVIWAALADIDLKEIRDLISLEAPSTYVWDVYYRRFWRRRSRSLIPKVNSAARNGINLFPPAEHAVKHCAEVCIGIVTQSAWSETRGSIYLTPYHSRPHITFNEAMLHLSAVWFACQSVNRETLIFTESFDSLVFKECYQPIIDAYTADGNRRVAIILCMGNSFEIRYMR